MTTTNIVSTPNITGNIGSCTTNVKTQVLQGGFWSDTGYTIATNSCTGEMNQYDYHSIGGGITGFILLAVLFIGFVFGRITS